jgi:glutathione S-transferase
VILYGLRGSCSMAVLIAAEEAGVSLEYRQLTGGAHKLPEYLAINPSGKVPALILADGEVLTEGLSLMQLLLDSHAPGQFLAPAGELDRYRVLTWCNQLSTAVHPAFSRYFYPPGFSNIDEAGVKEIAIAALVEHWAKYEAHFAAHEYCVGEHFSMADMYQFTIGRWGRFLPAGQSTQTLPAYKAYMQRVAARPAVQRALAREGISDIFAL